MANRKLKFSYEYRYGKRGVLRSGDRFKVRGGPVYVTAEGHKIPMGEKGLHIFKRYCERGAEKWIEAASVHGSSYVILWVGKPHRSPVVSGLVRRPYRVRKERVPVALQSRRVFQFLSESQSCHCFKPSLPRRFPCDGGISSKPEIAMRLKPS